MHPSKLNIKLSEALYTLILLSPCIYPGYFPFDVNTLLAVGTALMFIASILLQKQHFRLPNWPCYFFLAVTTIQLSLLASNSLPAPQGWELQFWLYLSAFLMFCIGTNLSAYKLIRWITIYIIVCIFWLAIGWMVWLGGTSGQPLELGSFTFAMAPAMKLAGPFNQGNIFATAIGMAWLFSHWLLLAQRSKFSQFAVIILTAGMVDTLSRGGWLAFLPCIILILYAFRAEVEKTALRLGLAWVVGLIIGSFIFSFSQPETFKDGFLAIAETAAASLEARLLIWLSALTIFFNHPITGSGWGQFSNQFWLTKPHAATQMEDILGYVPALPSTALNAHNMTFQMISEGGIVLCVGIITGLSFYLVRTWKLINRNSPRMPFALAALGFFIQAQVNVSYSAAVLFIYASFFAGIAMAPWLKKTLPTLHYQYGGKILIVIFMLFGSGYTIKQSSIWFETTSIIQKTNIVDKASLKPIVDISNQPRVRTIPLAWLTYQIATTREHAPLLRWISPMLLESAPEIPFVDVYQTLFYALANSGKLQKACEIGKLIEQQGFLGEMNQPHYTEACLNKMVSAYQFGH